MTAKELEKYTKMAISAVENEDINGIMELINIYTAELTKTFPVNAQTVPFLIIAIDSLRKILAANYSEAIELAEAIENSIETIGVLKNY